MLALRGSTASRVLPMALGGAPALIEVRGVIAFGKQRRHQNGS